MKQNVKQSFGHKFEINLLPITVITFEKDLKISRQ